MPHCRNKKKYVVNIRSKTEHGRLDSIIQTYALRITCCNLKFLILGFWFLGLRFQSFLSASIHSV